jgi:hypothetical protein
MHPGATLAPFSAKFRLTNGVRLMTLPRCGYRSNTVAAPPRSSTFVQTIAETASPRL